MSLLSGDTVWIRLPKENRWAKGVIRGTNSERNAFLVGTTSSYDDRCISVEVPADLINSRNNRDDHKPFLNLYNLKYFNTTEVASYFHNNWNREDQKLMSLGSGALSLNVIWLRALHEHGLALPFSESYLTSSRKSSKMVIFTGPSQSGKSVAIRNLLQSHSFRTPEVHQSAMLNAMYVLEAFCSRWNSRIASSQSAAVQYSFLFDDREALVGGKVRCVLLDVERVLGEVSSSSCSASPSSASSFSFDVLHSLNIFARKCVPFAQKFGLLTAKSHPLISSTSSTKSSYTSYRYAPDVGDATQLLPAYDELLGVLQSVFGVDEREQQQITKLLSAVILIGNLPPQKEIPISAVSIKIEPIEPTNRKKDSSPLATSSQSSSPSTSPSRTRPFVQNALYEHGKENCEGTEEQEEATEEKRKKVSEMIGASFDEKQKKFFASATQAQLHLLASTIYSRVMKWIVRRMNRRLGYATKPSSSSPNKEIRSSQKQRLTSFTTVELPSPPIDNKDEWMNSKLESAELHQRMLRLAIRMEQTATQRFLFQDGVTVPEEVRRIAIERTNELLNMKERVIPLDEISAISDLLNRSTNQILIDTHDAKVDVSCFCDKLELAARSADCLFMRCVPPPSPSSPSISGKPSPDQTTKSKNGNLEEDRIFQQFVRSFESVGIELFSALRSELYPYRMSHKRFASSFGPAKLQPPSPELSTSILCGVHADPKDFLIGRSKVYLRADSLQLLRTASLKEEIQKHSDFLQKNKPTNGQVSDSEISLILRPLPIPYTPSDPDHQNTIQSTVNDVKEVIQNNPSLFSKSKEKDAAEKRSVIRNESDLVFLSKENTLQRKKKPLCRKLLFDDDDQDEDQQQIFKADSDNEESNVTEKGNHNIDDDDDEEVESSHSDPEEELPTRERSGSAWERAVPRGNTGSQIGIERKSSVANNSDSVSSSLRPSIQLHITKMLATASASHHDMQNKERMAFHLQSLLNSVAPHRIGTEGSKPELIFRDESNSLSADEIQFFCLHFSASRPLIESLRIVFEFSAEHGGSVSLVKREVVHTFCASVAKNFNFSLANYSQSGNSVLTPLREFSSAADFSASQLVSMMLLWRICQALLMICTRDEANPSPYMEMMSTVRESGVLTSLISALLTRINSYAALLRDPLLHHNLERICIEILKAFSGRGDAQETNCLWVVSHSLFWPLVQHISALLITNSAHPSSAIGSGLSESDQKAVQLNALVLLTNITSVSKCVLLLQQQREIEKGSSSSHSKSSNAGEKCFEKMLFSLLFSTAPHDSRAALRALRLIRQCSNLLWDSLVSSGILAAMLKQVPIRGVEYVQDATATLFALHALPMKRNRILAEAVQLGALQVFVQSLIQPSKDLREKSALALCNFCSRNIVSSDAKSNLRKAEDLLAQMVRMSARGLVDVETLVQGVTVSFTRLAKDITKTNLQAFLVQLWTALDPKPISAVRNAQQNQIQSNVIPLRTPVASPARSSHSGPDQSPPPSAPSSPSLGVLANTQKPLK